MKTTNYKENFKALCKHAEEIAHLYFKALSHIKGDVKRVDLIMENNSKAGHYPKDEMNYFYLLKIEKAFRQLDVDSQKIINNDFFYNNYKFWWLDLYSTSTYYRLKRSAIAQFLQHLK
ncbi:MAG: hypothetical protein WCZ47_04145 [Bacilli bacterium]|jgi:hypothetical protein|nr:hypothetical protein [Bacilli bacterium]NLN79864.1 hypothetical protein [Erysipelotrichia bacterium]